MIFQSLGSNYNFLMVLKALFTRGRDDDRETLTRVLEKRYGGIAYLYDKGRDGLAAAVSAINAERIAINGTTCSVVVEALGHSGSEIVYLDVEKTGHFSAAALKKALDSKQPPKAVVIQNTYGQPCDIIEIERIAHKHHLVLIEDLAHSIGQMYPDGREVGTVGDIVMLSFGRDKVIDVVNGGAIIVREPKLLKNMTAATETRVLKDQLRDRFYPLLSWLARRLYPIGVGKLITRYMYRFSLAEHSADGGIHPEYTMPNWQARLALAAFDELEVNLVRRRKIVSIYQEELAGLMPVESPLVRAPLLTISRNEIIDHLESYRYYLADTWFDTPIGPSRKFRSMDYPKKSMPKSVIFARTVMNLPTHRNISYKKARALAHLIKEYHV